MYNKIFNAYELFTINVVAGNRHRLITETLWRYCFGLSFVTQWSFFCVAFFTKFWHLCYWTCCSLSTLFYRFVVVRSNLKSCLPCGHCVVCCLSTRPCTSSHLLYFGWPIRVLSPLYGTDQRVSSSRLQTHQILLAKPLERLNVLIKLAETIP